MKYIPKKVNQRASHKFCFKYNIKPEYRNLIVTILFHELFLQM